MTKEKKNNLITIGIILGVSALFILFSFLVSSNKEAVFEPKTNINEWLVDIKGEESVVTVFASSTCQHCQNLRKVIVPSAKKHGYKLYFFEMDTLNEEESEILTTSIELEDFGSYVPYTFVVRKGEFITSNTGEMTDSALNTFLKDAKVLN